MSDQLLRILLLWLLAIPAVSAALVALLGARRVDAIRWISLVATVACLVLACILAAGLAAQTSSPAVGPAKSEAVQIPTFQPEIVPGASPNDPHATTWDLLPFGPKGSSAVQFFIGLDGLNIWLVLLTAVLMVSAVLISWNSFQVRERTNEYYAWLLLLETAMLGVFVAFD